MISSLFAGVVAIPQRAAGVEEDPRRGGAIGHHSEKLYRDGPVEALQGPAACTPH